MIFFCSSTFGQTNLRKFTETICDCFQDSNFDSKEQTDELITQCILNKKELIGGDLEKFFSTPSDQIELIKMLGSNCEAFIEYITAAYYEDQNLTDKEYTEIIYKLLEYFGHTSEPGKLPNSITLSSFQAGIRYNIFLNKIYPDTVYKEGFHLLQPHDSLIIFEIKDIPIEQSLDVLTKDGLVVNINHYLRFSPKPDSIGVIFEIFGSNYLDTFIIPEFRSSTRTVTGNLTSMELYQESRENFEQTILDTLKQRTIEMDYFNYKKLRIGNIDFPQIMKSAQSEGLMQEYHQLRSNKSEERLIALKSLFDNGSRTAFLIILTHWSSEKDQENLDFILDELSKK